jgi:membrane associated rhomboid family serine protease
MSTRGHRGGQRFSFRQVRITRGAMYLLFAELGLSLVYLLSNPSAQATLASWVAATPTQVWHDFKLWTLVTSALLQDKFISLVFHVFILWMFVPVLERWWGTRKFLLFALWTSLAGTTVGTLVGLALGPSAQVATAITGLDPFIYGSIVAFGVLYGSHPVQFFGVLPLTGRQLMIGIIGFVTLFVIIGAEWALGAAYAASMGLAWLLTSGKWDPRLWYLRWKHKRARRHLKVVRDRKRDRETLLN